MDREPEVCSLCGKEHSRGHNKTRDYRSKKGNKTPIWQIRDYLSGYVGGCEVATKATDEDIISIVLWNDEIAEFENCILEIKKIRDNLISSITKRK